MTPFPAAFIAGMTRRAAMKWARTLSSHERSKPAGSTSSRSPGDLRAGMIVQDVDPAQPGEHVGDQARRAPRRR